MGFCGKWYKKDGSFNAYGNIREVVLCKYLNWNVKNT